MDLFFKRYDTVSRHPGAAVTIALLSITANVTGVLGFFGVDAKTRAFWIVLMAVSSVTTGVILVLGLLAVVKVYAENKAIKRSFEKLHDAAHYFRNDLCFRIKNQAGFTQEHVLQHEHIALTKICECVAGMFTDLIQRECHVCVTLTQQEINGSGNPKDTCFIWASSSLDARREIGKRTVMDLSKDIRFSEAVKPREDGPSHFFVADLNQLKAEAAKASKHGGPAKNETPMLSGWESHYVSCLVIPLRVQEFKEAVAEFEPETTNSQENPHGSSPAPRAPKTKVPLPSQLIPASPLSTLGFLKVETKFANRLNDRYHKYLLAACGDIVASQLALRDLCDFPPASSNHPGQNEPN